MAIIPIKASIEDERAHCKSQRWQPFVAQINGKEEEQGLAQWTGLDIPRAWQEFNSHDVYSFVASLKACAKSKHLSNGRKLHADIVKRGLLGKYTHIGSSLVNMYAKCGAMTMAQEMFDELPHRNVASWNALIGGYSHVGCGEKPLACFEQMQHEGIFANVVTFTCALKACGSMAALDKGEQMHVEIARQGLLEKDVILGNALVDMYAKCGALNKAQKTLDELPIRNSVSWNALIVGYAQWDHGKEMLDCFEYMQHEGLTPDVITFTLILKACASRDALKKGQDIHSKLAREGLLEKDSLVGTALLDMYAKCGEIRMAHEVLSELPVRDVVSYAALLAGYDQHGHADEVLACFSLMLHEGISPDEATFTCILNVYGRVGSADRCREIHAFVFKEELLEKSDIVGNALVDMYLQCKAFRQAHEVFEELLFRSVLSWNVLIAGLVQMEFFDEALECFERMQEEGVFPDAVSLSCILKSCGVLGAIDKGYKIHLHIIRDGFLRGNITVGHALVDMYIKIVALMEAQEVFYDIPVHDVVSWNLLLSGYSLNGYGEETLTCYEEMLHEGVCPDTVTLSCLLKACGSIGAADKGNKIHLEVTRAGLLEKNTILGNALVDMYVKCGIYEKAQEVFSVLLIPDIGTWATLITGYVQHELCEEALACFEKMQGAGFPPNAIIYSSILKACGNIGAMDKGQEVLKKIVEEGLLQNDCVLGNSIMDMFVKCGAVGRARAVFDKLPYWNAASWNTLIAGYVQDGHGEGALNCYREMQLNGFSPDEVTFTCSLQACSITALIHIGQEIHAEILRMWLLENDSLLSSALMDMYSRCGALEEAQEVFEQLRVREFGTWAALLAGYMYNEQGQETLDNFEHMQLEGIFPDEIAFTSVVKACSSLGAVEKGQKIHAQIVQSGLQEKSLLLLTGLVDMYATFGALDKAQALFNEFHDRDEVLWNALINGYTQHGYGEEALTLFEQMKRGGFSPDLVTFSCMLKACGCVGKTVKGLEIHDEMIRNGFLEQSPVVWNALVDMYAKCGVISKAKAMFDELPVRNAISWNIIISGYLQHGYDEEALDCFEQMLVDCHCTEAFAPSIATFTCIVKACGNIGSVDKAAKIHTEIVKEGLLEKTIAIGDALVNMYAKCGAFTKAQELFDELLVHEIVSWNGLLLGYALVGRAENVFMLLDTMVEEGIQPDSATFTILLNACSHSGLLHMSILYFETMSLAFNILPTLEHYTCIINLFGRIGLFDKALFVIENMPFFADLSVWHILLGSGCKWVDMQCGKLAFEHAVQLDEKDGVAYVCVSNICATAGMGQAAGTLEALRLS